MKNEYNVKSWCELNQLLEYLEEIQDFSISVDYPDTGKVFAVVTSYSLPI